MRTTRNFNFILGLALLVAFIFTLQPPALAEQEEGSPLYIQAQRSAARDRYSLITTSALRNLLQEAPSVLLVDVRFSYEYAQSHMPGAVSLPVDLRDRGDLSQERRKVFLDVLGPDRDRTMVLYCRDFR